MLSIKVLHCSESVRDRSFEVRKRGCRAGFMGIIHWLHDHRDQVAVNRVINQCQFST